MRLSLLKLIIGLTLCFGFVGTAFAEADPRMQVEVIAEEHDVEAKLLHADVRKAADLALPVLWQRLVPAHSQHLIPTGTKAVQFLLRAKPTEQGVEITFHDKRVLRFLQKHEIPYYAEQSTDAVAMPQRQPQAPGVMHDPAGMQPRFGALILTIERPASLPEQVLFEEELRRDRRVAHLSLRQVNRHSQQYRLQLKSADDSWLARWFGRRGLSLSPSVEGWVAR